MLGDRFHVLLVEDSPDDAALVRRMLDEASETNFDVNCFDCLADVVAHLRQSETRPDAVLLDLSLPDSTGLNTLIALHETIADVPIVVLSGLDDSKTAVEAVKAGAHDWISKNQTNGVLLERSLRYARERAHMQQQLRQSEERFRQLAENMNDVVWSLDIDAGELVYVSPAYEKIWGRPVDELYQNPERWLDQIRSEEREAVREAFYEKAKQGQFDVEFRITRPDGSMRWIHDRGFPVRGPDGRVTRVVGIAADITPYKDLQREIAESTAQEQQRIGQELHDNIGQQLTGIGLLARSLQRKLESAGSSAAAAAAELAENIGIAQGQLRKLIRGVMPVEIDANGLMAALDDLAKATEDISGVDCKFDCLAPVSIDDNMTPTHLYHIAREAVNNAVRHASAEEIHIRLEEINGAVIVQVWDNGCGIRKESTKADSMGLRIMRHRASVIGAFLDVRGGDEGGTVVTCTLRVDESHAKVKT
jgi:PAS domain S-box-containing protein